VTVWSRTEDARVPYGSVRNGARPGTDSNRAVRPFSDAVFLGARIFGDWAFRGDPAEADPGEADPGEADPGEADPGEADPAETDATDAYAAGITATCWLATFRGDDFPSRTGTCTIVTPAE
jgi:hypothetical protein